MKQLDFLGLCFSKSRIQNLGKQAIAVTLVFLTTATPVLSAVGEATDNYTASRGAYLRDVQPEASQDAQTAQLPHAITKDLMSATGTPFLDVISEVKELPPIDFDFSKDDDLLDKDPFFMRSQAWIGRQVFDFESVNLARDISWKSEGNVLEIHLKNRSGSAAWKLSQPFTPLWVGDRYIFLASHFSEEGLFVLRTEELFASAEIAKPVPVFFLPLPKGAWTQDSSILHFEESQGFLISDAFHHIQPIFERDIEQVLAAEELNLFLSLQLASRQIAEDVKSSGQIPQSFQNLQSSVEEVFRAQTESDLLSKLKSLANQISSDREALAILPPLGSTAGFGMMFTGIDLNRPERTLWKQKAAFDSRGPPLHEIFLQILGIDSVYADGLTPEQIADLAEQNAKLIDRVTRVSVVLGVGLIASVILRYTVYKNHFEKQRAERFPNLSEAGSFRRGTHHAREVFDVYAHVLNTVSQIPVITFANMLEFSLDRWAPASTSSEKSIVRRLLKKTVLFQRESVERVPVNWNTFFLGAIVLGGIDTSFVGVQLYKVVPWLGEKIGTWGPFWDARAQRAFEPGNPLIANLNRNEVIRNIFGYLTHGASGYSSELQGQLVQVVGVEVDLQLKKEGFNLDDPKTQTIRKKRIEEQLIVAMRKAGLPGPDEFLFDFITLYGHGMRVLGYSLEEVRDSKAIYTALERPGLVLSALKKAIERAESSLKTQPENENARAALKVLLEIQREATLLRNVLRKPMHEYLKPSAWKNAVQSLRKARASLIALTYEGDESLEIAKLPTDWVARFGQEGSVAAAQLYRKAFLSLVNGDSLILNGAEDITDEQRRQFIHKAVDLAKQDLQNELNVDRSRQLEERLIEENREQYENLLLKHRHALEARMLAEHQGRTGDMAVTTVEDLARDPVVSERLATSARQLAVEELKHSRPFSETTLAQEDIELIGQNEARFDSLVDEHLVRLVQESRQDPDKIVSPFQDSWFGKWQKNAAYRRSLRMYQARFSEPFDLSSSTQEEREFWRESYILSLMQQSGLSPDYAHSPELRAAVKREANEQLQIRLSDPKVIKFLDQSDPLQRERVTAELEAEGEVASYVKKTLKEDRINPLSPAQPGVFQKIRQSAFLRSDGFIKRQLLTRGLRTAEATVSDASYKIGFWAKFHRSVPFAFDTWTAFTRSFGRAISHGTAVFLFNKFFWGADISWPMWMTFVLMISPTIMGPMRFLNRLFNNQNWKPMGSPWMTALLGFFHTWATFWGTIPHYLFAEDIVHYFNQWIGTPIAKAGSFLLKPVAKVTAAVGLLGGACSLAIRSLKRDAARQQAAQSQSP